MGTKLIIDRSKWLRGEGETASKLLRERDGKMCCLGFYLLSCGLEPDMIQGRGTPGAVYKYRELYPEEHQGEPVPAWTYEYHNDEDEYYNTFIVRDLIRANDEWVDDLIGGEKGREERITALFATQGIEVEFIGE